MTKDKPPVSECEVEERGASSRDVVNSGLADSEVKCDVEDGADGSDEAIGDRTGDQTIHKTLSWRKTSGISFEATDLTLINTITLEDGMEKKYDNDHAERNQCITGHSNCKVCGDDTRHDGGWSFIALCEVDEL